MRITKPEDLKLGQWYTICCFRCLREIKTQEDIEDIIDTWEDTGLKSMDVWETKLEALQHDREVFSQSGKDFIDDVAWIDEEIRDILNGVNK